MIFERFRIRLCNCIYRVQYCHRQYVLPPVKYTHTLYFSLLAASLVRPCLAANTNAAYCEKQAREITQQIVKSVLPDLSADQRARVQTAANQACLHLVTTDPKLREQASNSKSSDWFTNYVLHGKPADKPGNKRLEHLK